MEQNTSEKIEFPREIEGIELPENFELTLESYILDPDQWQQYLAKMIAKALENVNDDTNARLTEAILRLIILTLIEQNHEIESNEVKEKAEKLNIHLFVKVINYLYGLDKKTDEKKITQKLQEIYLPHEVKCRISEFCEGTKTPDEVAREIVLHSRNLTIIGKKILFENTEKYIKVYVQPSEVEAQPLIEQLMLAIANQPNTGIEIEDMTEGQRRKLFDLLSTIN